jgi:protein-L-isoaspartate(D-aspartate) O-methyltransferase
MDALPDMRIVKRIMQDIVFGDAGDAEPLSQSAVRRQTMVDCQIRTFEVTDRRILARMLEVPREQFLPPEQAQLAYSDLALVLKSAEAAGEERRLLAPLVLARLIQGAEVKSTDSVLDIAPGTGYSSALLAGLAARVCALESEQPLYEALQSNFARLGLANAQAYLGPLGVGVPDEGPYDVILVNGKVEANLEALFAQLRDGGRLLALESVAGDLSGRAGRAVRYEKAGEAIGCRVLFDAASPVLRDFRKHERFTFN